mmetsp:Transcript_34684/g.109935  ORF Transcript_34684/g.109935 Transcript_34684/m.109935 type:complete len:195 (-) Transcript_34684:233-817(-)
MDRPNSRSGDSDMLLAAIAVAERDRRPASRKGRPTTPCVEPGLATADGMLRSGGGSASSGAGSGGGEGGARVPGVARGLRGNDVRLIAQLLSSSDLERVSTAPSRSRQCDGQDRSRPAVSARDILLAALAASSSTAGVPKDIVVKKTCRSPVPAGMVQPPLSGVSPQGAGGCLKVPAFALMTLGEDLATATSSG